MKEIRRIENEIQKWEDGKMSESFFSLNPQRLRDELDRWYTKEQDGHLEYHGKVFQVGTYDMELPSGKIVRRELVVNPQVVCMVPVDMNGDIWMIRQMRPVSQFPILELPAGKIDEGEWPAQAAIREMGEETGFEAKNLLKIGSFFSSPGWCTEFVHCFLVSDLSASFLTADTDEEIEVVKVSPSEVMGKINKGEINCAKTITALLLALPKINS